MKALLMVFAILLLPNLSKCQETNISFDATLEYINDMLFNHRSASLNDFDYKIAPNRKCFDKWTINSIGRLIIVRTCDDTITSKTEVYLRGMGVSEPLKDNYNHNYYVNVLGNGDVIQNFSFTGREGEVDLTDFRVYFYDFESCNSFRKAVIQLIKLALENKNFVSSDPFE